MRPDILTQKILEIMALRRFKSERQNLVFMLSQVEKAFSIYGFSLLETQQAILDLAEHGYPNQALGYLPKYAVLYSKLFV